MIIDVRTWSNLSFEDILARRCRVFVDGVEINCVWYVDTNFGYVRTYDVLGGGREHTVQELRESVKMESDWDEMESRSTTMSRPGSATKVASKTIMGAIELKPYEESKVVG